MTQKFTLLPYAVSELLDLADAPIGERKNLNLSYDLRIKTNGNISGAAIDISGELRGPGDVIGIDRTVITRIEPSPGIRGFEPNYFPLMEFDDVDFPWRYSLDSETGSYASRGRRPWITIIALEAEEFSYPETSRGPLPSIEVNNPSLSLPPPDQLWAYAHVHLDDFDGTDAEIDQKLINDDHSSFSRILCPRKLKPLKTYYAFLVPTYEAGRLAGLGLKQTDIEASNFDMAAWGTQDITPLQIPFYYQWRFTTDAMEDLESLMRRLEAYDTERLTELSQSDVISAADPGYYPGYSNPSEEFARQTAIQIPRTGRWDYETDALLSTEMIITLDEVIEGEIDTSDDEDPLVAFPPYGFRYPDKPVLSLSAAENGEWFNHLNLDLKYRQVASLGADIVRKNQEEFMTIAWMQYDEIVEANLELMRLETSRVLTERMADRHLAAMEPESALTLAEPMLAITQVERGKTVSDFLSESGEPLSYSTRSLRQQSSKRSNTSRTADVQKQLQSKATRSRSESPELALKAMPVPRMGARNDAQFSAPSAKPFKDVINTEAAKELFALGKFQTEKDILDLGVQLSDLQPVDVILDKGVSPVVLEVLSPILPEKTFEVTRPATPVIVKRDYDTKTLTQPVIDTLKRLPNFKARFSLTGLTESEQITPRQIWRSPEIPMAMSLFLEDCDPDSLLSGADNIPDNSIVVMEENRQFIEALLVGMNHEMNNELRWREFPTDMQGTIFKRFWNRGASVQNVPSEDIAPIHTWTKKLGENVPVGSPDNQENFVVIIKGDIIRKLNNPIVSINIAAEDNKFVVNEGEDVPLAFVGKFKRDTNFYGFEFSLEQLLEPYILNKAFFVIYEPAGELRFGLDVATAEVRRARFDDAAHSIGFEAVSLASVHSLSAVKSRASQKTAVSIPPANNVTNTDDLSWSHMDLTTSNYIDFSKNLPGIELWSNSKTSASTARSFWQKPIAGVLPLARVV